MGFSQGDNSWTALLTALVTTALRIGYLTGAVVAGASTRAGKEPSNIIVVAPRR
jgi:hypothetical protein